MKQQAPNTKHQTPDTKQQTPNNKRQTLNTKHDMVYHLSSSHAFSDNGPRHFTHVADPVRTLDGGPLTPLEDAQAAAGAIRDHLQPFRV